MISAFSDPLFFPVVVCSIAAAVTSFLLVALPYSALSWIDPPTLRKYRIQERRMAARRVFWPGLAGLAVNAAVAFLAVVLCWPVVRLSGIHAGTAPAWYEVAWQLPVFLLLDDGLYYWLHRALHTRWLYKHIHCVHHRNSAPWAISGGHFHPAEYLLITATALSGPVLLGAHVITLWIWLVFRQWEAADGHSGYMFPWNPARWLPGYKGAVFHDFHHAEFRGNYANYLAFLDEWCGTLAKGYVDFRAHQRAKGA